MCQKCNPDKKFKNHIEYASPTPAALFCSSSPLVLDDVTCTDIDNCHTVTCYSKLTSGLDQTGCTWCSDYYMPTSFTSSYPHLAGSCVTGTIVNCRSYNNAHTTITYCYDCKEGYSVNSAGTSCIEHKTDDYCRMLYPSPNADKCAICLDSYYFSGSFCTLASHLIVMKWMSLLLLVGTFVIQTY